MQTILSIPPSLVRQTYLLTTLGSLLIRLKFLFKNSLNTLLSLFATSRLQTQLSELWQWRMVVWIIVGRVSYDRFSLYPALHYLVDAVTWLSLLTQSSDWVIRMAVLPPLHHPMLKCCHTTVSLSYLCAGLRGTHGLSFSLALHCLLMPAVVRPHCTDLCIWHVITWLLHYCMVIIIWLVS